LHPQWPVFTFKPFQAQAHFAFTPANKTGLQAEN